MKEVISEEKEIWNWIYLTMNYLEEWKKIVKDF
jgi:hypothetical protein